MQVLVPPPELVDVPEVKWLNSKLEWFVERYNWYALQPKVAPASRVALGKTWEAYSILCRAYGATAANKALGTYLFNVGRFIDAALYELLAATGQ